MDLRAGVEMSNGTSGDLKNLTGLARYKFSQHLKSLMKNRKSTIKE